MINLLRRIRAGIVNAAFWGVGWFGIGLGSYFIPRLFSGAPIYILPGVVQAALVAAFGFCLGGAFSLYLAGAFRHSRIERISTGRFVLGGALVTVLFVLACLYLLNFEQMADEVLVQPVDLYGTLLQILLLAGSLGGITAWGTLRLANAGSEFERLESGDDVLAGVPRRSIVSASVSEQANKR